MKSNIKAHRQKPTSRGSKTSGKSKELIIIVSQLIVTTVILSLIALYAAKVGIQSDDFWDVLRAAITLQSTLQGVRMLVAISK